MGTRGPRNQYEGPTPIDAGRRGLDMPAGLAADEAATWRAILAGVAEDHFRPGEAPALVVYVRALCQHARASAKLAEEGEVVPGARGLVVSPWVGVQTAAAKVVNGLGPKLRLVPSARMHARQLGAEPAPGPRSVDVLLRSRR